LYSPAEDINYDLDASCYQPIEPIGNLHGVMLISLLNSQLSIHDLQVLHHGCTVIHWDTGTSNAVLCHLRVENDTGTLSWTRPNWSALQSLSTPGITPDYLFTAEEKGPLTSGISNML
jgi:phosphatidylinositol phospholipase C epsilon